MRVFKTAITTFLSLIFCTGIFAQFRSYKVATTELMKLKERKVEVYEQEESGAQQAVLKLEFGSDKILNAPQASQYQGKNVVKVELVYTDFSLLEDFNQPALNNARLEALKRLSPELFNNTAIEWEFTGQTACRNEKEAKDMFHGFVVTYHPIVSVVNRLSEIDRMKQILNNDSLGQDSVQLITTHKIRKRKRRTGQYYPKMKNKREKGIMYDKRSIWNRRAELMTYYDTTFNTKKAIFFFPSEHHEEYLSQVLKDSTIFKVMDRNKDWTEALFVCDVTSSMLRYSTELLLWHRLNFNARKARYFTFFNDGDNLPDNRKQVGRTGGIYHIEANTFRDVEEMAMTAISKGSGGDGPENDLEALITGMNKFPQAKEIVLVADNHSNIKDIALLRRVHKPVHVILCGSTWGINVDYLNLVRETAGTIHTIEQDINNLKQMREGESIEIGPQTFVIRNGEFKLVYNS